MEMNYHKGCKYCDFEDGIYYCGITNCQCRDDEPCPFDVITKYPKQVINYINKQLKKKVYGNGPE